MEQSIAVHPEIWRGAPITFVRTYLPSVSFYARHTVTLVTEDADELRSNYAVRHADTWLGRPGFALEPWSEWRAAPPSADPRAIFIAKARDAEVRRILDRDCALLKETGGVAIYRSCRAPGTLAPDAGVR
jgi:hypothetical protein